MTAMKSPFHERVILRPTERAEFMALARRFGPQPKEPTEHTTFSWMDRAKIFFFSHPVAAALLLPLGICAMAAAVIVGWPLGLVGAGLVIVGQVALFELVRAHRIRRRLLPKSQTKRT